MNSLARIDTQAIRPEIFPRVDHEQAPASQLAGLLTGLYEFNGECHPLGLEPDWLTNPSADIEWQILWHKFYYAPAMIEAAVRNRDPRFVLRWIELTDSWMRAVPPGFIAADVTGRRVQNWLYAWDLVAGSRYASLPGKDFVRRFLASIAEQTRFLCANLTPKRNHRTLELHAIYLAGVALPQEPEAEHWRSFALTELLANMRADLLADGVHCELSTDYHHLVLRNLLSVRRLATANGHVVPTEMDHLLQRALDFSMHAHNPAGIVPSFSDGDARSYLDLLDYAATCFGREDYRFVASGGRAGRAPGTELARFDAAGYYILRSGWGRGERDFSLEHHLMFDCGPLGEGNHGHLDCLSFELSAGGRRLVVDPGRYTYSEAGETNWRARFRGTAAHNTVTVDGRNQTRYAPKPAKPGGRHPVGQMRHRILGPAPAATLRFACREPGIALLAGRATSDEYPVVHERTILFLAERLWLIVDRLRATDTHAYQAGLQLAPESSVDGEIFATSSARGWRSRDWQVLTVPGCGRLTVEPGWVSDRYGEKRAAPRLVLGAQGANRWLCALIDPEANDGIALRELRLDGAGAGGDDCLLQIDIAHGRGAGDSYQICLADEPDRVRRYQGAEFSGAVCVRRMPPAGAAGFWSWP